MNVNLFMKQLANHPFLIMAHRGVWGGNIIENSIESSLLAFKAGADIVEVDVCRTSDNRYYLFHDGNEQKLLSRKENFKLLTSKEIDNSDVYNAIGEKSGYKINKLTQFLKWLPENKLVNLDRSWEYWDDPNFFQMIKDSGKQDQFVLKSPVNEVFLDNFSNNGISLAYIPIIKSIDEYNLVNSYQTIHTIGIELVVDNLESELLDSSWLKQIKKKDLFTVANSENLGSSFNLFGGLNDDVVLLHEGEWNEFIKLGIDVIQTDWVNFLFQYREKLEKGEK